MSAVFGVKRRILEKFVESFFDSLSACIIRGQGCDDARRKICQGIPFAAKHEWSNHAAVLHKHDAQLPVLDGVLVHALSAQRITASAASAERSEVLVRCKPQLGGVSWVCFRA